LRDDRAHAMVTFALALVPFVGLVGLVVDLSQYEIVHTELQDIADAFGFLAGRVSLMGRRTRSRGQRVPLSNSRDLQLGSPAATTTVQVISNPVFFLDRIVRRDNDSAEAPLVSASRPKSAPSPHDNTGERSGRQTFVDPGERDSRVAIYRLRAVQPLMLCTPFASTNLDASPTRAKCFRLKPKQATETSSPVTFNSLTHLGSRLAVLP